MALSQERLKNKIREILDFEALQEENPEDSRERFADRLATAVVEEIMQAKIIYTSGLTSATGGVVTGNFQGELK